MLKQKFCIVLSAIEAKLFEFRLLHTIVLIKFHMILYYFKNIFNCDS